MLTSCLLQGYMLLVLKVAQSQAREGATWCTEGPGTLALTHQGPPPPGSHPPCRGRPPRPAEQLRGMFARPLPIQRRWHVGAPAGTGSAGRRPSQEELPALWRAGLRRDHISAGPKMANAGVGPEMPLEGRGRPGSCSQGEIRGRGGADWGGPTSSHFSHHGDL